MKIFKPPPEKPKEVKPEDSPHYAVVSLMLVMTGHASSPEEATELAKEFFRSPDLGDLESELAWWLDRFAGKL